MYSIMYEENGDIYKIINHKNTKHYYCQKFGNKYRCIISNYDQPNLNSYLGIPEILILTILSDGQKNSGYSIEPE